MRPRRATSATPSTIAKQLIEPGYSARDLALCSSAEAREFICFELALRLKILPISIVRSPEGPKLHCATGDAAPIKIQELRFAASTPVSLTTVSVDILEEAIVRAYLGSTESLERHLTKLEAPLSKSSRPPIELATPKGDAAQFLKAVLEFAAARGASDIHLCPLHEEARIKLRVDGVLLVQEQQNYPRWIHEQMIGRLKVLAKLDTTKRTLPQDGSFTFPLGTSTLSARVSTLPTIHGESAVVRLLGGKKIPNLQTIDLEPSAKDVLEQALRLDHGAILLTGPTGSGKTTTLYGAMLELVKWGKNVVTVEDPVEMPIPGITQVQVSEDAGLSYPAAIRSVLRHDPDALLIGEIRDALSGRIAMEAAASGHLTLSSVHAGTALGVLDRLTGLGIDYRRTVEVVTLVINQRLLPKLCPRCKVQDIEGANRFGALLWKPVGCPTCDYSGFDGRVVICECLPLLDPLPKERLRAAGSYLLGTAAAVEFLIPWTVSLQYQLTNGAISIQQFQTFLDTEMVSS